MHYTENEIIDKLNFLIEPNLRKAENYAQQSNPFLAHGTIENMFDEFKETKFFKSFSSSNEKFIEKYSILENSYLERLIDTIGSAAFANVKISFYDELIGLLLKSQFSLNDF
ncbi:hypothetical protein [Streptococcus mitis]|jgi:hypothetical protein|uniref:hypothetical protein n=1 Tax=Streptococcus mitis TaxID=28037 RepID=UPI0039C0D886